MEIAFTGHEATADSTWGVIEDGCFLTLALYEVVSNSKVSGSRSGQVLQPIQVS